MSDQVTDRNGEPINIGDTVAAKARGGKHAGEVQDIVTDKADAEEKGVKNPPKVILQDQVSRDMKLTSLTRAKVNSL